MTSAGKTAVKRTAVNVSAGTERDHRPGVIDADHLHRMTLGDRRLEREVLELFVRQTAIILDRIAAAEQPAVAAAAAHTLKGSARGIGAWRVARAAEMVEQAANGTDGEDMEEAAAELRAASLEASAAIGARLTVLLAELAKER